MFFYDRIRGREVEVSRGPFGRDPERTSGHRKFFEDTTTSEVSRGPFGKILNGPLDTEGFKMTRRDPSWRSGNTGIPQFLEKLF